MKWATSLTSVDQNIESQVKNLQEQGKTVVAFVSNNQLIDWLQLLINYVMKARMY